jgi:trimeric autotransporter adhesin
MLLATTLTAQVSITTDGSSPDPSSMLDVKSSNKGMLVPRVALTSINNPSPITSPAVGLLVYNTATTGTPPDNVTQGFHYWNGTRWMPVAMPQGTVSGDMLYWNGTQWVLVPSGEPMQILKLCDGIPTWGPCTPLLTTTAPFGITQTAATSGGIISNDGGDLVTTRGVCWNNSGNPTTGDSFTEDGSGTGAFASEISGLSSGVTYYLRAYATNSAGTGYGNEISFNAGGIDGQACPGTPAFIYGGQTYNTVKIGSQCWMKENLNYGTMINGSQPQADNQVIEKYCYGNDQVNCPIWGGLYQWNEMMNYSTQQGSQGVCSSGWHIPADAEYCTLATYLDATADCQTMDWTGTNAGGKMKETGTAHWWDPNGGATNSSGFSGISGGYSDGGTFGFIMSVGHWWTSSTDGSTHPLWMLRYNDALIGRYKHASTLGFSVRCVKDIGPGVTTSAISDTTATSASCGGNVVSEGGAEITARGICWNTTGGPTIADYYTTDGSGTGTFTSQLTDLEASTTYFVRAYANTAGGVSYGNQVSFTTFQAAVANTAWELAGNSGTNPSVNFIGTTDWQPLRFRMNNFNAGELSYVNTSLGVYSYTTSSGAYNTAVGFGVLHNNSSNLNTGVGHSSLQSNTEGTENTAVGSFALNHNTEGDFNVAVGSDVLTSNLSGMENTAIGTFSLISNSTGSFNTATGSSALSINTTGAYNTATGYYALTNNQGGNYNTAIGCSSLSSATGTSNNVALGYHAGSSETGSNKLYIDGRQRANETDGRNKSLIYGVFDADPANQKLTFNANVGIGTINPSNKLHVVTTANPLRLEGLQITTNPDVLVVDANGVVSKRNGSFNSGWLLSGNAGTNPATNFIGTTDSISLNFRVNNKKSGEIDVDNQNTSFGYKSLFKDVTGVSNTAIGSKALYSNLYGYGNTAMGEGTLYSNTQGTNNTSIGKEALYLNETGLDNTAIGVFALYNNSFGFFNTAVGREALYSNISGYYNTSIGVYSLHENTYGYFNTASGYESLRRNTTGQHNSAFGSFSLSYNSVGQGNIALGYASLYDNTTGNNNTVIGIESLANNSTGNSNVAIGVSALLSNTTRSNLVAIGDSALYNNGVGATANYHATQNTAIGSKSLYSNTSGFNNTAIGYNSLKNNTTGSWNTASGVSALYSNTEGGQNTAIGFESLIANTTGLANTAVGSSTLYSNQTGYHNTACGSAALYSNTTGFWNTACGSSALYTNTTGTHNTALGVEALNDNTTGDHNTACGVGSLTNNTSGTNNTATGGFTLFANTTGNYNTATGVYSLDENTTGIVNTAYGALALSSNTTGNNNTAIGYTSLENNTVGSYNTAGGLEALHGNTTGVFNTALGAKTLYSNTIGYSNVAVGNYALYNSLNRSNLVAIGDSALYNNGTGVVNTYDATQNTAVGSKALYANTNGYYNTAMGFHALILNTTGYGNTSTGAEALGQNSTGYSNTANGYRAMWHNTTGYLNTAVGYQSMHDNAGGTENTAIGYYSLLTNISGNGNTAVGDFALRYNTTGSNNTIVGYLAGPVATYNYSNTVVVGYNANTTASNQVRLGNSSITTFYCQGAYEGTVGTTNRDVYVDNTGKIGYVSSSARYKDNIGNMEDVDWLYQLRPVNFTYKNDEQRIKQYGLIAEEVEKVAPEFVSYNREGRPETVSYSSLIAPLLKAVQEQKQVIEELKRSNEILLEKVGELEKR